MKFKYTSTLVSDTKGRFVKRPVLRLELTTVGGRKIYPIGLVDSGTDLTLVNIQYAKELGLDVAKLKEKTMRGIGEGTIPTFLATFPIKPVELGKEIIVPACYIDSKNVDVLIGQEGFFDTFKIKFEKDHDVFELIPVKK